MVKNGFFLVGYLAIILCYRLRTYMVVARGCDSMLPIYTLYHFQTLLAEQCNSALSLFIPHLTAGL